MRAAVCLFGTIGGTKGKSGDKIGSKADVLSKAYPYYKDNLIEPNSADVFIHSWDVEIKNEVIEAYSPILSKFEPQKSFDIPDFMETQVGRYIRIGQEVLEVESVFEYNNSFFMNVKFKSKDF